MSPLDPKSSLQRLLPQDSVCLLIDVQEKLLPSISEREALMEALERLLRGLQILEVPIIVSEQYRKGLGSTEKSLLDLLPTSVLRGDKRCFSLCDDPQMLGYVRDSARDTLLICGLETHICVWQTARDLKRQGYRVVVVEDATSARSRGSHACALSRMRFEGIEIADCEMVLFDLQQTSMGEEFKSLAALIR